MSTITEAYAKRKNEGFALPQKEWFGQIGASSDYGTNRTMAQFSSKLSCSPKLWNTRESRLNGKSREAVTTNTKLEQLLLSVQRAYQTLCDRGFEFSAKDIKEKFQGSMQNRTTFLQRYDQMVEDEKQLVGVEITARWHSMYYMLRKHLQVFIQERYHTGDTTLG